MHILIIDDEEDIGEIISLVADNLGFSSCYVTEFDAFKQQLTPQTDVVIVDLMMPGTDGIELLRYLRQQDYQAGIILMSGFDQRVLETAQEMAKALGLQVLGLFQKPLRVADLEARLQALQLAQAVAEPVALPAINISEAELHHALAHQEFLVYYQPQIEIKTGKPVGMETLVRWQHPLHGLIAPGAFIDSVEAAQLIDPLTWHVVERMLSDSEWFQRQGWEPNFSVNFSVLSLHDLQLPEHLSALAKKHQVSLSRLVVEITESGLIDELATALDILARLRLRGAQVSIDDYGTGYSMLQQLQRVPANEIKIDQSFVRVATSNASARVLVQNTIELARQLDLRVVAEGVEDERTLSLLAELGCDLAQGYLFSPPLPARELCAWLIKHQSAWIGALKPQ